MFAAKHFKGYKVHETEAPRAGGMFIAADGRILLNRGEQRARVQNWYQELKDSSASAWEKARKGFSDAYEALSEQWNNTEEELQDSEKRSDSI